MTSKPQHDPSIQMEPHLRATFRADPGEAKVDRILSRQARTEDDAVEHSVWDEPTAARPDGSPPADGLSYAQWLMRRRENTSAGRSWAVTLLAAAASGPWSVIATLLSVVAVWHWLVAVVITGPITEEILKAAIPLYIVEKRPYLFRSRMQIALCAIASGLVFAAIENVLYLQVYVPEPSSQLILWRWTVCVALHTTCCFIASIGMMSIWSRTMATLTRPNLTPGLTFIVIAAVVHGSYNALAVVLEFSDYELFRD